MARAKRMFWGVRECTERENKSTEIKGSWFNPPCIHRQRYKYHPNKAAFCGPSHLIKPSEGKMHERQSWFYLDICPWIYFWVSESTRINMRQWKYSKVGLSNDEPSQLPYSLHIYWTNTTKIAKIHWVLVVSASVKITLLQKPAYSAVHNCNSTRMPQMQNTVFLLYLHSGNTYSNKGGRGQMHRKLRPMGSEERRKKCSACASVDGNSQKLNSSEQSLPCQRKS